MKRKKWEHSPEACVRNSMAQQNRKPNKESRTGEKGINPHSCGVGFEVRIGGSYIGYRRRLSDAVVIRDEARKKLYEYANENTKQC